MNYTSAKEERKKYEAREEKRREEREEEIEKRRKKYEEIWEMNTFLEKFEAYHNLIAYGLMGKEAFEEGRERDMQVGLSREFFISEEHIDKVKKYLLFLNEIPTGNHMKEVDNLVRVMIWYSSNYREYDTTYADTYDDEDNRVIKNMSDKRRADIKIAKNFRDSLHKKSIPINDHVNEEKLYTHITQEYIWKKEESTLHQMNDMSILIASLTLYIDDLESQEYKISKKEDYQNFSPKPPVKELIECIKSIIKTYEISNTTKQLKDFQKALVGLAD